MRRPSRLLIQSILFSVLSSHGFMMALILSNMAQPIMKILNKTSVEYLDINDGGATLTSFVTFCDGVAAFFTLLFVLPLMDSMGRKFVCVYLKFIIGLLTGIFYILTYLFQSSSCLILASIFMMTNLVLTPADSLYFAELWENNGYFTASVFTIPSVVAGPIIMFLSRPGVIGDDSHWYLAAVLGLVVNFGFLIVGMTMDDIKVTSDSGDSICNRFLHRWSLVKAILSDGRLRRASILVVLVSLIVAWNPISIEIDFPTQLYSREGMTVEEVLTMNLIVYLVFVPFGWFGPLIIDQMSHSNFIRLGFLIALSKGVIHILATRWPLTSLGYTNSVLHHVFSAIGYRGFVTLICSESLPLEYTVVVIQVAELLISVISKGTTVVYPLVADFSVFLFVFLGVMDIVVIVAIERIHPNVRREGTEEKASLLP